MLIKISNLSFIYNKNTFSKLKTQNSKLRTFNFSEI